MKSLNFGKRHLHIHKFSILYEGKGSHLIFWGLNKIREHFCVKTISVTHNKSQNSVSYTKNVKSGSLALIL